MPHASHYVALTMVASLPLMRSQAPTHVSKKNNVAKGPSTA